MSIDIARARNWLSNADHHHGMNTPPDYPWFGCETDEELKASIVDIAKGEKLDPVKDLERVLSVMLFS
jgi:hypothetical protein